MRHHCQWNSDTVIEVIYFFDARLSQAEHSKGFKAAGRIRLISAIKPLSALARLIHQTDALID
jgi:hypothetical protein